MPRLRRDDDVSIYQARSWKLAPIENGLSTADSPFLRSRQGDAWSPVSECARRVREKSGALSGEPARGFCDALAGEPVGEG